MSEEVVGVAWAGGGTKSKVVSGGAIISSDKNDPIGTAEPTKTTESRAARRAIRQLAHHRPELAEDLERGMGETAEISARIASDKERNNRPSAGSGKPVSMSKDPFAEPPAAQISSGPLPAAEPAGDASSAEVEEPLSEEEQRLADLAEDQRTLDLDAQREADLEPDHGDA